jgi:hypothetical protein
LAAVGRCRFARNWKRYRIAIVEVLDVLALYRAFGFPCLPGVADWSLRAHYAEEKFWTLTDDCFHAGFMFPAVSET